MRMLDKNLEKVDTLKESNTLVHLLLRRKLSVCEVLNECLSWGASHALKQLDDLRRTEL